MSPVLDELQNRALTVSITKEEQEVAKNHLDRSLEEGKKEDTLVRKSGKKQKALPKKRKSEGKSEGNPNQEDQEEEAASSGQGGIQKFLSKANKRKSSEAKKSKSVETKESKEAKEAKEEISFKDQAEAGGSSSAGPSASSSGIKAFFSKATKQEVKERNDKESEKEKEEKEKRDKERQEKEKEEKLKEEAMETDDIKEEENDSDDDFKDEKKKKKKKRASDTTSESAAKKRKTPPPSEVCTDCGVALDKEGLSFYAGHPEGAVEEIEAITSKEILGEEEIGDGFDFDEKPQHKITNFVFYDTIGHIVKLDAGIIENGGKMFVSGYMKPIFDDSTACEGGKPVKQLGPILEWWVAGLDGSDRHVIGITTDMGWYYLMAPHDDYKSILRDIDSKIYIGKAVIDLLNDVPDTNDMEYEDLLLHLEGKTVPSGIDTMNSDNIVKYADTVVSMVCSYEEAADEDEDVFMMDSPAIKQLMAFAGLNKQKAVKNAKKVTIRRGPNEQAKGATTKAKKALSTAATTTLLVRMTMESFFKDKLAGVDDKDDKKKGKKAPKDEDTEEDEIASDDEDMPAKKGKKEAPPKPVDELSAKAKKKMLQLKRNGRPSLHWEGDAVHTTAERTFYPAVVVDNDDRYEAGDFALVYVDDSDGDSRLYLRRVEYLFENDDGEFMAHVQWFEKGCYTVLGDVAEEKEVFQMGYCDDTQVANFIEKAKVTWWGIPKDEWFKMGGTDDAALLPPPINPDDANEFYYRMRYDEEFARFEHGFKVSKKEERENFDSCKACPFREAKIKRNSVRAAQLIDANSDKKGRFTWGALECYGEVIKVNEACYWLLTASHATGGVGSGRNKVDNATEQKLLEAKDDIDQVKYPEFYRKRTYIRGSNLNTAKPFSLGIITEIVTADLEGKKRIRIAMRKLHRPEDTCLGKDKAFAKDFNLVYWTDDTATVDVGAIQGKCFVRPECSIDGRLGDWSKDGQNRFYYNQMWNRGDKEFSELPSEAERYGRASGKSKGKGKSSAARPTETPKEKLDDGALPKISRPKLRSLDVFAGCGGLSCGLHETGAVESKWAIEVFEPAALAYKVNNPDCTVFTDCCNALLESVMKGDVTNDKNQVLPKKGEVDLLCGGPPCQGFSGMNRFNHREYSAFKNSLIASYLSYADYYRPKFFILENVRNFASYKSNQVLKLCLRSLLKMGYACTFGILQAGDYGVAQTRRRAILLAAAPGESLPFYPEPTNVFAKTSSKVNVSGKMYGSNIRWKDSAPFRTVTVRDVMSDLPPILSGHKEETIEYKEIARSPFQRKMRSPQDEKTVTQHISKNMSAIVDKRMELIPLDPGSDWRDLPNTVTKLKDGTYSEKLIYRKNDYREGRGPGGVLRGVCTCAEKKGAKCDGEKQGNTLIPWCLPHTSARHNQWAGLYGRLEYDGYFSTTVTNPEPMGKQGRVLHPDQHRVVSVRECARSQGFPDWYRFQGTILEKHRQIGNAVPPPMGYALGVELRKAMMKGATEGEEVAKKEEIEEVDEKGDN